MELTYRKVGDYYLPELIIPSEKISRWKLGKYGRARLKFLREHKKGLYTSLMMKNELQKDLYPKKRLHPPVRNRQVQPEGSGIRHSGAFRRPELHL